MVRFTVYVLVSILGGTLAGNPWLENKWVTSTDGRQRPCHCTQPHKCSEILLIKSLNPCKNKEVCCESLKEASDEDDIANGVVTRFDTDVGGEDDSPEKDDEDEGMGKESEELPPIIIKFTEDNEDFYNPEDLHGSSEDAAPKFECGIATPHLIIDEKQAADPLLPVETTRFGQYPWNLVILYTEDGATVAICGATLIEPKFAITAAHCVAKKNVKSLTVRAGEYDLNDEDETNSHEDRTIKSMVIHERYEKFRLHNDIAFIELSSAFELSPHIGKLCYEGKKESVNKTCVVTGWGMRGNEVSPNTESKMKAVAVELEEPSTCEEKLRQTDLGPKFRLSKTALCATAVRKGDDTSIGDGGGPLFCKSKSGDHYTFVGITSWGKLKYPRAPGVYTAVQQYREWIANQMMKALDM